MEAVFLKILELSLYGSLLILAVLPLRLLLRKAPKWMTCLLWAMVAVALICPVRLESPASVVPTVNMESILPADTAEPGTPNQNTVTAPVVPTAPAVTDTPTVTVEPTRSPAEIASVVWVCGMGLMALYALLSVLRLRKRVGACLPVGEDVYLCDDIETPFILGLLRPRIYLPSAIDEITTHQVLLHERAHLQRRDHWWKPLGFLLLTLHWFNPLVWVGYVLLCRDIELACDEKVVRDMAASDKKQYTEALLTCSVPRHMIAACPLAFGEVGVKQRIKAVLNYKKPAFWVILVTVIVCVALCFGFLTNPISDDKPKEFASYFQPAPESLRKITVETTSDYEFVTASDIQRLCGVLGALQFSDTPTEPNGLGGQRRIILETTDQEQTYLIFSADYTTVRVSANGESTETYTVLNPETLQQSDFPQGLYWAENAMSRIIEGHLQASSLNASNLEIIHEQISGSGIYAVVSFDLPNAQDQLCLVQLGAYNGEFYVLNMVSGHRAQSEGIYPNMAILNGQTVLWTAVNSNAFRSYRVVFESGESILWSMPENASVLVLPDGETPVKVVPLDSKQNEVPTLAFGEEYFVPTADGASTLQADNRVTADELVSAVTTFLNSSSTDYTGMGFEKAFLSATEYRCVAEIDYVTDSGFLVFDTPVHMLLTYDGRFSAALTDSSIAAFLPADTPLVVTVSPNTDPHGIQVLLVSLNPATGEILSISTSKMDPETGEINELCGYPTYQAFPLYLDMDDSFKGHEALYAAMKACDKLPNIPWSSIELAGTLTCEGYEYAAVSYSEGREPMAMLLEYQTNDDGTVTLLAYAKGHAPDTTGFLTGYYVNQSTMSCGTVYWSLFDTRYATSKNGKEVDSTKSTEPKFTAFRFTMRDLKTHDFPVEGDFFLAQFSPIIPPAIVTPMEGKTLLAALGSEPMGGLTGTITLTE